MSEAARWTAERFYGGRYRIIPNGVDLAAAPPAPSRPRDDPLRLLFVGRAEERKGLPVLLRAFEALRGGGRRRAADRRRRHAPRRSSRSCSTSEGVEVAGGVSDDEKWRLLREADLLCAPSLGGESFGMVLTEAFAAGTPVVASDIAGYRDVVRDGVDGVLVPPGDADRRSARRSTRSRSTPSAASAWAPARRERAERFAWPHVAQRGASAPTRRPSRLPRARDPRRSASAVRTGLRRADRRRARPPRELPSLETRPTPGAGGRKALPRGAQGGASSAARRSASGSPRSRSTTSGSSRSSTRCSPPRPVWVLVAFALMCASMLMRAEAWHAVLKAALPGTRVRRRDTARGDDDRRADVGHAAGAPRRAVARADRRAARSGACASACPSCSARSSRRRSSTSSRS